MHRPIYHGDYDRHGNGIAEICAECSHDNVLVPVSFCREAMKYMSVDDKILDLFDEWHNQEQSDQDIHEYLGWTYKEYTNWVENYEIPVWYLEEHGVI